jgi:hypothetical protein
MYIHIYVYIYTYIWKINLFIILAKTGEREIFTAHNSVTTYRKDKISWVLMVHAYNPSYSGGRDQKDLRSKPAQKSSL